MGKLNVSPLRVDTPIRNGETFAYVQTDPSFLFAHRHRKGEVVVIMFRFANNISDCVKIEVRE